MQSETRRRDSRVARHPKCGQCLCEIIIQAYRSGSQNANGIEIDFPRRIIVAFSRPERNFFLRIPSVSSLRRGNFCGNYMQLRLQYRKRINETANIPASHHSRLRNIGGELNIFPYNRGPTSSGAGARFSYAPAKTVPAC